MMKATRHMASKRADAAVDVSAWEREIDEHVYPLYLPAPGHGKQAA